MDEIDWELCGIYGMLNALGGLFLTFLFCVVTDDRWRNVRRAQHRRIPLLAIPYSRMDPKRIDVDPPEDRSGGVNNAIGQE